MVSHERQELAVLRHRPKCQWYGAVLLADCQEVRVPPAEPELGSASVPPQPARKNRGGLTADGFLGTR